MRADTYKSGVSEVNGVRSVAFFHFIFTLLDRFLRRNPMCQAWSLL